MDESTSILSLAIGARVKQERQTRGWTLDQLAEATGGSRPHDHQRGTGCRESQRRNPAGHERVLEPGAGFGAGTAFGPDRIPDGLSRPAGEAD
ncbi:helix-turn-helix domain-containing protein [Paenarthrobacter nicotinovorans]|uniref:helix-turn-helix domain-containing protein n=1 Tax=Paenarthrobacter nicotinovorans TaxID=29320 RepID=UPI00325FFDEE